MTRLLRSLTLAAGLVGALLGLGGCLVESGDTAVPVVTTCSLYDDFLYGCTDGCAAAWDCERNYDSYFPADQDLLDACADCLSQSAYEETCFDCALPGHVGSCEDFMADLLGASC